MTTVGALLEKHGVAVVILGAIMFGAYRGANVMWRTVERWGDRLLERWIESSKSLDAAMGQMLVLFGEHTVSDERRHSAQMETMSSIAQHTTETLTGAMEREHRATRREVRELKTILTGAEPTEDSGDIDAPEENAHGQQKG